MRFLAVLLSIISIYSVVAREISYDMVTPIIPHDFIDTKALIDFDEGTAITIGRGYDTLTDTVRGDCIEKGDLEAPDNSEAQKVTFSIDHITSRKALVEKFNVSLSAGLKKGFGKLSAKSSFISEQNLNEYSVYVLAKVGVINVTRHFRYPRLTDEAVNVYVRSPERFRRKCGNEYFGAITTGGEFYAILEIETKDENHKREIMASLRGNVGVYNGSAEFSNALSLITSKNRTRVMVYQIGGEFGPNGIPTTPEEIIAHSKTFHTKVRGPLAMPISVTTSDYNTVMNYPDELYGYNTIVQEMVVAKMIEDQESFLRMLGNIHYILKNREQFINPDIHELNRVSNIYASNINKIILNAKICFNNYNDCKLPTDLDYPEIILPVRVPGFSWKDVCKRKEHSSCGDPIYKEASTQYCGVKLYKLGRGEACGVEQYKLGRSAECGVEIYNQGTGDACGTEVGYLKQEFDPGYRNCLPGRHNVSAEISVNQGLYAKFFPDSDWHNCSHKNLMGRSGPLIWASQSICQNRHSGHWWIICRGQVPGTCRHFSFGIERYNQCRAKDNGVESYLSCRNEAFGVESYHTCRHKNHEIERYQICYAPKDDNYKGVKCSQNENDYE